MAPHSQAKESPAKDFTENLRTVHLSLLAVCLALAVVLFSPPPYAVRKANQDLRDIVDAASEPLWPKTWLLDAGKEEASRAASKPVLGAVCEGFPPWHPQGSTVILTSSTPAVVVDGRTVALTVDGPAWYITVPGLPGGLRFYPSRPTWSNYGAFPPRNLGEFKDLWDTHAFLHCPREISSQYWIFEKRQSRSLPLLDTSVVSTSGSIAVRLDFSSNAPPDSPASAQSRFGFDYTSHGPGSGLTTEVMVPVASTADLEVDGRAVLIRKTGKNQWHDAEFSRAFPELEEMTSGFQDLDFAHLEKILRLQEKNSKEGLEAFGIRFPVENTARWGILLIIAIQIYFWMHLREYRDRVVNAPPVAWIGAYTQPSARIFFGLTAFLLPVVMVSVAAITVSLAEWQWFNVSLKGFAILASMTASGRAAYQYLRKPGPAG